MPRGSSTHGVDLPEGIAIQTNKKTPPSGGVFHYVGNAWT